MSEYNVEEWVPFAQAQLGGAAALAGLVFVALSINLKPILASQLLVRRAAESIGQFVGILVASTFVMIPGQEPETLGWELGVLGLGFVGAVLFLQRGRADAALLIESRTPSQFSVVMRRALGVGAPFLVAVAGASLIAGSGGGLHWWVGGVILGYFAALTGAWVLLVEILR